MSYLSVMCGRVVLGEVVSQVGAARGPEEVVLALFDSVLEPVEAHVYGFGAALLDSVREDAVSDCIVCFEGSGWLGMAKFNEGLSDGASILSGHEGGSGLGFRGGGDNWANLAAEDVDGTIVSGRVMRGVFTGVIA